MREREEGGRREGGREGAEEKGGYVSKKRREQKWERQRDRQKRV